IAHIAELRETSTCTSGGGSLHAGTVVTCSHQFIWSTSIACCATSPLRDEKIIANSVYRQTTETLGSTSSAAAIYVDWFTYCELRSVAPVALAHQSLRVSQNDNVHDRGCRDDGRGGGRISHRSPHLRIQGSSGESRSRWSRGASMDELVWTKIVTACESYYESPASLGSR